MRRYLLTALVLAAILVPVMVTHADPPANFLTNGSFEDGLAGWTVTNKSGDKVICSGTPAAHDGVCALKIKGGGVGLTLVQSATPADLAELNTLLDSCPLNILSSFYAQRINGSALTPEITLTVKYTHSGYIKSTVKQKFTPAPAMVTNVWISGGFQEIDLPALTDVTSIKLQLRDKNANGVIYLDTLMIGWEFDGLC